MPDDQCFVPLNSEGVYSVGAQKGRGWDKWVQKTFLKLDVQLFVGVIIEAIDRRDHKLTGCYVGCAIRLLDSPPGKISAIH